MLIALRRLLESLHQGSRGQSAAVLIIISFAIAMTAAIAVDIGYWARDARHAQNDADSIVLAAVLELPENGTAAAQAVAADWATKNNVPLDQLDCCTFEDRDGDGRADTVHAQVNKESRSLFARMIGIGDPTVSRKAAAMRVAAHGSSVMPWAVFCEDESDSDCGLNGDDLYAFHWGDPGSPGNFDALALDGTGASHYRDAIVNEGGSSLVVQEGDDVFVMSKPGNMGKNTCDALYDRAVRFLESVPTCGSSSGTAACDASSPSDAADKADSCPGRVVVLPVTEPFENGRDTLLVYRVGTFYIAGWDRSNPYGKGYDPDGNGTDDMVWGYFIPGSSVMPDFLLEIDPENPGSGTMAPRLAVLIE